jgi:hypothetical protein
MHFVIFEFEGSRMLNFNHVIISLFLFLPEAAFAEFLTPLKLGPTGCRAQGECKVLSNFRYTDPNNVTWQANKGNITDGASIPKLLRFIAGQPFDPRFTKAAVIHDHYSKTSRPVRPWKQTQRVFFDALIEDGLNAPHSNLLYLGVLLGSKRWRKVIKGQDCGDNCINKDIKVTTYFGEDASYMTDNFINNFKKGMQVLNESPEMSPEDIESLAKEIKTDDDFLHKGDEDLTLKTE